jgi:hypothetical protein
MHRVEDFVSGTFDVTYLQWNMSYIGKLGNNSVLGNDASGRQQSLSLGNGLAQSNGTLSADVAWNTAFDIDMTTAVSCSYTSDGTASIAGLNWDLWNSTNLVSVGVEPGVGMVVAHGTAASAFPGYGSPITAPLLSLPIKQVIPNWDFTQELRLWAVHELTGCVANYQGVRIGIGNNNFDRGNSSNRPSIIFESSRYFETSKQKQFVDKTLFGNAAPFGGYLDLSSADFGINNDYISGSMIHLRQQSQCDWYHFSLAPTESWGTVEDKLVWTGQVAGWYAATSGVQGVKTNSASSGITSGSNDMAIFLAPINYVSQTAGHSVTIRRLRLDYR